MHTSFHHLACDEDAETTHTVALARIADGSFGLDVDRERVIRIVDQSQRADLRVGDRITAINGVAAHDLATLSALTSREAARFVSLCRPAAVDPGESHPYAPRTPEPSASVAVKAQE